MPKTRQHEHVKECIGDLEREIQGQGKTIANTAVVEVAFLRGYQAGYEDCFLGEEPKHFVNKVKK